MKLSLAIALLVSVANVNAASISPLRNGKAISSLMGKSRRLEDANAEEEEEEEFAFLQNYSLKFITCKAGEKWKDPENGEYEYGVAVYRLCPDCDDDVAGGCKSGYGEYVVGLNTFVDAYFEDQRENMQGDDNFKLEEYSECREYEVQEADGGRRLDQAAMYYVGPSCTEDGDIKLGLFSEYTCTTESDVDFTTISGGMNLPYSTGGLVPSSCHACYGKNDNGEYEVSEYCMQNYESSYGYGCESKMESYSANGMDESKCEYIAELTYTKNSGGGRGWAWFWVILIVVLGVGGFIYFQKKRKSK
jgi:hypothetical protein